MQDKPVIIVGGGPVGLGAALELARCGVRSVLIERHAGTSWHPKTRNFNTRTMEIAMGWGEATYRRLRNIDTPPGWKSPIRFLESAVGRQFGQIESLGFEGPGPDGSPAEPVMSSQDLIEAIMLDAAHASGLVELRFQTRAVRLLHGGGEADVHVELEVEDVVNGQSEVLTGPALVAADGSDSGIRTQLGLEMEGVKNISHLVNCYFLADIEPHLKGRHGVLLFVNNPGATGVLQPLNGAGRWLSQINVSEEDWSLERFTKERAREWVRAAAGIPDLEVDVLSLGLWKLNATTVERFVQGRVLLCGDAAHQFPPTGGLGVNTGLQGMHNAMWKLAMFIKGQAGWGLVQTYHEERRPVSREIVMQSLQNSANVARINAASATGRDSGLTTEEIVTASRRYGNHLGVEFGAAYQSSAVVPDGTAPPQVEDSYSDYRQSATPGCRAPHIWLGRFENRLSTLHLVGRDFTLLTLSGGGWGALCAAARDALGVPINLRCADSAGIGSKAEIASVYGLTDNGGVLIRPDGHVAARFARECPTTDTFMGILSQVLAT